MLLAAVSEGTRPSMYPAAQLSPVSEKSGHGQQKEQVFILSPKVKRGKTTSKGSRSS